MLHIKIGFESSWTNTFADEHGDALFMSGTEFKDSQRGLLAIPLVAGASANQSRVSNIRRLNAANPGMLYRVPASYDNTIKGIIARLMGEVARVKALPTDHPVHAAFARTQYTLEISAEYDEIVSFATRRLNEVQTSGAGLLPAGNPLYAKGALAEKLFGHLSATLEALIEGAPPAATWAPGTPSDLIGRLLDFKKAQAELIKERKAAMAESYVSPFAEQAERIRAVLGGFPTPIRLKEDPDTWNWAGAVVALRIHLLPDDEKAELIAQGALSKNGGLPGLAMSGGLGNVTEKDLYKGAGCQKAYSNRMPYSAEVWFGDEAAKQKFTLGIIKKNGSAHIEIDLPDEEAKALKQLIEDAAVGPFHFGKKGIAYVKQMYVRSH